MFRNFFRKKTDSKLQHNITSTITPDDCNPLSNFESVLSSKTTPLTLHPHQINPIKYLVHDQPTQKGLFMYYKPGSGKTITALSYIKNYPKNVIIICPDPVISVWKAEISQYQHIFQIIENGVATKNYTFPQYKFNCHYTLSIFSYEYIYNYFNIYEFYTQISNNNITLIPNLENIIKFNQEKNSTFTNILQDAIVICDESQYFMRFFYLRPEHKKIVKVNQSDVLPDINTSSINQIENTQFIEEIYKLFWTSSKLILMSATPVFSSQTEMRFIINLIAGREILPTDKCEFIQSCTHKLFIRKFINSITKFMENNIITIYIFNRILAYFNSLYKTQKSIPELFAEIRALLAHPDIIGQLNIQYRDPLMKFAIYSFIYYILKKLFKFVIFITNLAEFFELDMNSINNIITKNDSSKSLSNYIAYYFPPVTEQISNYPTIKIHTQYFQYTQTQYDEFIRMISGIFGNFNIIEQYINNATTILKNAESLDDNKNILFSREVFELTQTDIELKFNSLIDEMFNWTVYKHIFKYILLEYNKSRSTKSEINKNIIDLCRSLIQKDTFQIATFHEIISEIGNTLQPLLIKHDAKQISNIEIPERIVQDIIIHFKNKYQSYNQNVAINIKTQLQKAIEIFVNESGKTHVKICNEQIKYGDDRFYIAIKNYHTYTRIHHVIFEKQLYRLVDVENNEEKKIAIYDQIKANKEELDKIGGPFVLNTMNDYIERLDINRFMDHGRLIGNIITDENNGESNKFKMIIEKIRRDIKQTGERRKCAVVFSNFDSQYGIAFFIKYIKTHYPDEFIIAELKISETDEMKNAKLKSFADGDIDILCADVNFATGINIIGAKQLHLLEPSINDNLYNQIISRVQRMNSHDVYKNISDRHVDIFIWHATFSIFKLKFLAHGYNSLMNFTQMFKKVVGNNMKKYSDLVAFLQRDDNNIHTGKINREVGINLYTYFNSLYNNVRREEFDITPDMLISEYKQTVLNMNGVFSQLKDYNINKILRKSENVDRKCVVWNDFTRKDGEKFCFQNESRIGGGFTFSENKFTKRKKNKNKRRISYRIRK